MMTEWKTYLRAASRVPPHVAARKAVALSLRIAKQKASRRRAIRTQSYLADTPARELRRRLRGLELAVPAEQTVALADTTRLYLDHRFDILGSGWQEIRHGLRRQGLAGHAYPPGPAVEADPAGQWLRGRINPANLAESQRIWRFIEPPYAPIDWQLDIKSGYRWSEGAYFRDITYGDRLGVDVKVPWELARLQHLPQLALAYRAATAGTPGFEPAERYATEFRNQVLDFLAANPPRFGVNWTCAMDVALRIVNVLLALDLFRDAGATFDRPFLDVVTRSTAEHARHIVEALEWAEAGRGNHYLSDILGLLFAAAYLPRSPETDAWLAFATREFLAEAELQFLDDGGNVEASTAYHRLSGELLAFGTALLAGLKEDELEALAGPFAPLDMRAPQPTPVPLRQDEDGRRTPLPQDMFVMLARAAELTRDATKPSGEIVQWGDNDSGRVAKLCPPWRRAEGADRAEPPWVEDALDHRAFVAVAAALTTRDDLAAWAGWSADAAVASALARGRAKPVPVACPPMEVRGADPDTLIGEFGRWPEECRRVIEIPLPAGVTQNLRRAAYPRFGHYAFAGPRFFLAIRCPASGAEGGPGHAHDDALTVELQVDGQDLVVDPGTFVYTPLPAERNRYRAAAAHFCPRPLGKPSADLAQGLFQISGLPASRCLFFGESGFAGEAQGRGWTARRVLRLHPGRIVIADLSLTGPLAPLTAADELPPVCIGYGCQTTRSPRLI